MISRNRMYCVADVGYEKYFPIAWFLPECSCAHYQTKNQFKLRLFDTNLDSSIMKMAEDII